MGEFNTESKSEIIKRILNEVEDNGSSRVGFHAEQVLGKDKIIPDLHLIFKKHFEPVKYQIVTAANRLFGNHTETLQNCKINKTPKCQTMVQ